MSGPVETTMAIDQPGAGLRLYATRARQLLSGPASIDSEPLAPPLPPGRVVTLPGRGDVFVRDQDGPSHRLPLLLLHGWIASAELNWFGAFKPFLGERRVVAIDHRGHGRGLVSPHPFRLDDCADDAAALLTELGIEQAIVAGFSMGGPIALLMARRHPHQVAALVPAATAMIFSETLGERLRWRAIRILELGLRVGLGDRLVARMAAEWAGLNASFAPYTSWFTGEVARSRPRAVREAGTELSRFDARPWAPALAVPAAMVLTGADSLVPARRQWELAEALEAQTIALPDADHDVAIGDAERFGQAIHSAVAEVEAQLSALGHSSGRRGG